MRLRGVLPIVVFVSLMAISSLLWAMELVSPVQNALVHPGETVAIKVIPSPGENLFSISFGSLFENEIEAPPYEYHYTVGPYDVGDLEFDIIALSKEGQVSSSIELHLRSTLPSAMRLQSIDVEPNQGLLFLEPETLRTKKIGVAGVYSDGVKRSIKGLSFGTTYQSDNEKVVTVDEEGILHAVGIGKAVITIKNGDRSAQTRIEVRAKPRF